MKANKRKHTPNDLPMDDMVICAGHFNATDPICHDMCALRVRCAIESRFAEEMELFEDMFGPMTSDDRIQ
ncbi:MAG: hypothetical protein AB1547_01480 [Thermodesulfobacteriota bacterium]